LILEIAIFIIKCVIVYLIFQTNDQECIAWSFVHIQFIENSIYVAPDIK